MRSRLPHADQRSAAYRLVANAVRLDRTGDGRVPVGRSWTGAFSIRHEFDPNDRLVHIDVSRMYSVVG
ncbi:hypothetical protein D3C73_772900 [compost metagenome]